jgi:hypothetical protein
MFPLLDRERDNPLELFQIWLNLPSGDKFVDPHFAMFWDDRVPRIAIADAAGRTSEITVVAGAIGGARAPAPPPRSWAARAESDVAIWTIKMEAGATLTLPAARAGSNRMLYFFRGSSLAIGGRSIAPRSAVVLAAEIDAMLENGPEPGEVLVLQGRPIGEMVVQHGPFVMNSPAEIEQAFADYRRTGFGGWPWPSDGPVHGRDEARFAKHADGRVDAPERSAPASASRQPATES